MSLGQARTGLVFQEPVIFQKSVSGRRADSFPTPDVPLTNPADTLPSHLVREEGPPLPELSEPDVVRHFTRLSSWNFGIDSGFYPLGSCTMKYNPRVNEKVSRLPGLTHIHPYQPQQSVQGALALIHGLERMLAEISGFARVTLQPAAGAHGELVGLKMVRAYHENKGNPRKKVLIPDTAHGTNPASCALNGYDVVPLKSCPQGYLEVDEVEKHLDDDVAAVMLTNPNTLGIFEADIGKIVEIAHAKGALVYCDGANMNAIMGITRPGDWGVDVMQFNLHKTFSTPHGGGGPGSGPVGVSPALVPHLPTPTVERNPDGSYRLDSDRPHSIGQMKAFYGNFSVMVKAYAYLLEMGGTGLKQASQHAVLSARYLRSQLEEAFDLAYHTPSLHEFVLSDKKQKEKGVKTFDLAKRLIDYGFHPPTVYFPLVVNGALMIEPTETESKDTLDAFANALLDIAGEVNSGRADLLLASPQTTIVGRLDETATARNPVLCHPLSGQSE